MKKVVIKILLFLILWFVIVPVFALESTEDSCEMNLGFIFNSNNILLSLSEYNGGIGVKFLFDDFGLRASIGGGYETSTSIKEINAGLSAEKYIFTDKTRPYFGGGVDFSYINEYSEIDSENWTNSESFSLGGGGLLGIEYLITDVFSVFAEYELRGYLNWLYFSQSVNSIVVETESKNYGILTDVGNSFSIGVVIYFKKNIIQSDE